MFTEIRMSLQKIASETCSFSECRILMYKNLLCDPTVYSIIAWINLLYSFMPKIFNCFK